MKEKRLIKIEFDVLILGNDFNTYYMSRCFHELYNKKANVIGRKSIGVVSDSKIINFKEVPNFETKEGFIKALNEYAKK